MCSKGETTGCGCARARRVHRLAERRIRRDRDRPIGPRTGRSGRRPRSLSADILTTNGRRRLPTGARASRLRRGVVELADGQRGAGRGRKRAPRAGAARRSPPPRAAGARAEVVRRRARTCGVGAPSGASIVPGWCKRSMRARGIKLPRDNRSAVSARDRRSRLGSDGAGFEAGDLLFFFGTWAGLARGALGRSGTHRALGAFARWRGW